MATAHTCTRCGAVEPNSSWNDELVETLASRNLCFSCNVWHEKLAVRDHPDVVRIAGVHYTIAPETPKGGFRGFGGARFWIQRTSNDVVRSTTNLWCQGDIPPAWRSELPDNATFIEHTTN